MAHDHLSSEYNRLKEFTRRNLLQFVKAEFTVAHTVTDLAETEARLDNPEHARALLEKARRAIAAVRERLAASDMSEKEKSEIIGQFAHLKPRLLAVQRQTERSLRKRSSQPASS